MTTLYTSLDEIKSFRPCISGWENILKGQRKSESDSILFPLIDCVGSNSISDVCWLLGKRKKEIQILVKFAKMCADSVSHLKKHKYAAAYAARAYSAARAAYAAAAEQKELNKSFLVKAIKEYENSLSA